MARSEQRTVWISEDGREYEDEISALLRDEERKLLMETENGPPPYASSTADIAFWIFERSAVLAPILFRINELRELKRRST